MLSIAFCIAKCNDVGQEATMSGNENYKLVPTRVIRT